VKTLDEQEVQSSAPAVSKNETVRQAAQKAFENKPKAEAKTPAVPQSQVDCYESCLDLSALFLGRG
jgi:hypothetical protein